MSEDVAERRAWATVNKESGGGNKAVPEKQKSNYLAIGFVLTGT